MADQSNDQGANAQNENDAADPRQNVPRTGIPGKGFDAGTGYGGGGNDALYSAESSYGGQSGIGGSRMRGAYAGEEYGSSGPGEEQSGGSSGGAVPGDDMPNETTAPNVARDTDGRGSANAGEGPADPNTEAVTQAFEGPDAVDLQDMSGASRREPGR